MGRAFEAFEDKYTKAGKLKAHYTLADMRDISFWDFSSAEEMLLITLENPAGSFVHEETTACMDRKTGRKVFEQAAGAYWEAAKKAAKK